MHFMLFIFRISKLDFFARNYGESQRRVAREIEWHKESLKVQEEYVKRFIELPEEAEDEDVFDRRYQDIERETGLKVGPADFLDFSKDF